MSESRAASTSEAPLPVVPHPHESLSDVPTTGVVAEMELYLFCNPSSGGNAAAGITNMGIEEVLFAGDDHYGVPPMRVHIFNLKKKEQRLAGFDRLAESVAAKAKILAASIVEQPKDEKESFVDQDPEALAPRNLRVIAAGGDGTVKWIISELRRVDCLHVPIGIIPFGTGNDLSRVLQWGAGAPSPLLGVGLISLKGILAEVALANASFLDVWQVKISVDPANGKFMILSNGKEVEVADGEHHRMEDMINYFSLGCDAQIVWAFEKKRHKSAIKNKVEYGLQGSVQLLPGNSPPPLGTFVSALECEDQSVNFRPNDKALIFQNIPSYAGGLNLWGRPQHPGRQGGKVYTPQAFNDGKLELLTVGNPVGLGLQVVSRGVFKGVGRLAQGSGYRLDAKESVLYTQIDGEPLKVVNPTDIVIENKEQVMILKRLHPVARGKMRGKSVESSVAMNDAHEAIIHQGVLYVRSTRIGRKSKWKKKFFMLHQLADGRVVLEYYSKVHKVLRGKVKHLQHGCQVITLQEMTAQYREAGKKKLPISWSPNPTTTFAIHAGRKVAWLCAENVREKTGWMEAISSYCSVQV